MKGVSEATKTIQELVIPWRREHAKKIAKLERLEKLAKIKALNADISVKEASLEQESFEKENLDLERRRLENDKLRLEVEESRINLALKIIDRLNLKIPDEQRIMYVMKLLEPLGILTSSNLNLAEITEK